jgi:hypothetical protein
MSQQLQTLRTELFWFITQRVVVIYCRRFGTTCLSNFTFMWPCIVTNFFLIKPTDAKIAQIYFVKKLYMFRAVPLPIIRSFSLYIRHWYMSCSFDHIFQAGPGLNSFHPGRILLGDNSGGGAVLPRPITFTTCILSCDLCRAVRNVTVA